MGLRTRVSEHYSRACCAAVKLFGMSYLPFSVSHMLNCPRCGEHIQPESSDTYDFVDLMRVDWSIPDAPRRVLVLSSDIRLAGNRTEPHDVPILRNLVARLRSLGFIVAAVTFPSEGGLGAVGAYDGLYDIIVGGNLDGNWTFSRSDYDIPRTTH